MSQSKNLPSENYFSLVQVITVYYSEPHCILLINVIFALQAIQSPSCFQITSYEESGEQDESKFMIESLFIKELVKININIQ